MLDILLPTYNGARYLPELLASLDAQTWKSWNLLVRDDASHDASAALVEKGSRGNCLVHRGEHVGVVRGMDWLLAHSTAPYFMPADQDDIWMPQKIAKLLDAVQGRERVWGADVPVLAFCDLELVDAGGRSLGTTFRRLQGLSEDWETKFQSVLTMSGAPGCAMLGNAALRDCVLPLPDEVDIYMHDWWILLCAAALGVIVHVPEPLVRYRQHEGNFWGARSGFSIFSPGKKLADMRRAALCTQRQAATLLSRHEAGMRRSHAILCKAWASMPTIPRVQRWRTALTLGFVKPGFVRNLAFYAVL